MDEEGATSEDSSRGGLARLDAYRVAVDFYRLIRVAVASRRNNVIDQFCRAAESVVLNIAEAYPMSGLDRSRRFRIAAGEAAECRAGLDLLEIRGDLGEPTLSQARDLLDRVRAMLWRLSRA